jgi:hypothetical protein
VTVLFSTPVLVAIKHDSRTHNNTSVGREFYFGSIRTPGLLGTVTSLFAQTLSRHYFTQTQTGSRIFSRARKGSLTVFVSKFRAPSLEYNYL